jgi:S-(hydroxymethyl)glutathione dehydrogenase/alcohol dehydrogenase
VGTFSQYSVVPELCCIPIDKDIPLQTAALVGCGVPTGWGSAVNAGGVEPGNVVIVMGSGGLGINAVQGARHAGAVRIIAADPLPFRRSSALEFGATDAVETIEEAADLARSLSNGQGADVAVVTTSVLKGEHIAQAFDAVRKDGTVVATAVPGRAPSPIPLDLAQLSAYQKRIQGCLYGAWSPTEAVPALLDLYRAGHLKLDELITTRYKLDDINQGYEDMHAGKNIRGVIIYD